MSFRPAALALSLLAPLMAFAVSPFDYDATANLAVTVHTSHERDGAQITDLSFAADPTQPAQRTRAYLVTPLAATADHRHPAILWGHWLGEPETTHRGQYLDEAIAWAHDHGAVSLLPEAMWAAPGWYRNRVLAEDRARGVAQVIAFRRALDLLLQQPEVDPTRAAFVAHDYSAMYGAIALAHDKRIRHAVFIAAAPTLEDWAFYVTKPDDMAAYLAANRDLHLPTHLAALTGRHVLLQWAEDDFYVPTARRDLFVTELPAEQTVKIYPGAGHEMTEPATIRADRTAWLESALEL